jgi:hypothetical protein
MALTKALGGGGGGGITQLTGDVTAGPGSGSQAATIAAGAVDIAHLSATGTPSSSTFLRGDNTWATPSGGGGGGLVWLATVIAAAAASADFTSLITSTYDEYELTWGGLVLGTNGAFAGIQLSTNNGSSWITTGYEYGIKLVGISTSFETYQRAGSVALAAIGSALMSSTVASAGETKLFRANTSERKAIISDTVTGASDGNTYGTATRSAYPTATTFNAIRVLASAGTITGTFRLYGRAKV